MRKLCLKLLCVKGVCEKEEAGGGGRRHPGYRIKNKNPTQSCVEQETAHAEESWSYDYDTYWTDDWSGYESYYGYDGGYSQGDWYNWSYFASAEELTESEDKHSESSDVISEDGQTDQINRFCFSAFCLFRFFGHELVEAFAFMLLFVSLMYQCFADLNRSLFKSIRHVEDSVSTESGDLHSFRHHTCPLNSVTTEECVFLNYDHGAQQALLCEYVDLGSHPTYVILDSGCTRAMGSRFAIERLVQACQQHPKRDHIWFTKQPCSSKFSFANGEQSTRKDWLSTFAMIMHTLVGSQHALTFWTKVRFPFSFQSNKCGIFA